MSPALRGPVVERIVAHAGHPVNPMWGCPMLQSRYEALPSNAGSTPDACVTSTCQVDVTTFLSV
jgi:hypothetical protein